MFRRSVLLGFAALALWAGLPTVAASAPAVSDAPPGRPGGRLVAALGAEPRTFNPLLAFDNASRSALGLLTAGLARIDRATGEVVPALADSWAPLAEGQGLRLHLRRGVRFSDGEPFDADDVVFTFGVYLDEALGSPNREGLIVGGEPVRVVKIDSHTVDIRMAAPYAVGARMFDGIAILPEHVLGRLWREGRLAEAWHLGAPLESLVGLGPFRAAEYRPGERLVVERNPHYWKRDRAGGRLPYLDRLVLLFVPDDDARVLRFAAGETDLVERLGADDFLALASRRPPGVSLRDLGPSLDYTFLLFNLNRRAPTALAERQGWFRDRRFRRAVSLALDRDGMNRLAYRGKATPLASPFSAAYGSWLNRRVRPDARSVAAARKLLGEAGFRWRDDGRLLDAAGRPVGFSVAVGTSNQQLARVATILQDDLAELGIEVRVAPLEHRALVERMTRTFDYDTALVGLGGGDADPNVHLNVLTSSGQLHLWHLGEERPEETWERRIDELMRHQLSETDPAARKRLVDEVQVLLAENVPVVYLLSPHVLVGARADLGNFRPSVLHPHALWNADELYWRREERRARR